MCDSPKFAVMSLAQTVTMAIINAGRVAAATAPFSLTSQDWE